MKNEEYKKLSIKEFTKAAGRYESNHAGIYEMCKKDYPDILEELEKEPFRDLRGKTHSFLSQRRISILSLMQDTQSRHLMNVRITNL